ncbi:hypothetical protein L1887_25050 [Cichorium endivia]|nr:hypothetical protein L1887_25050 [Cichorium endivia]
MPPITIYLILIFSLFIPPHPTTADQSFISSLITQTGLDFVKNLLISKAIPTLTATRISAIEKTVRIPVIGKVHIVLSDITINRVNVGLSKIKPDVTGVTISGSDVTCDLSLKWHYAYGTWLGPISISDSGTARVKVIGMETGTKLGLHNEEGSLKLYVINCNCHMRDMSIDLNGGASWLYQGVVDAFEESIRSEVSKEIIKKLKAGVIKLGSVVESLPKLIEVDDIASLNVTFVNDPFLSDTSLGFGINGLFVESKKDKFLFGNMLPPPVSCSDPSKMVGIALDEAVFNSAFGLYYNAMFMRWVVDKVPEQNLLNTAGWRFIVPQLYKKYPNDDMNLEITLSSPPIMRVSNQNIDATVYADLVIDVLPGVDTIPVACISLVMTGVGTVEVTRNNLTGHLKLDDFTMSLKWSKIGTLHMFLIQPVMWTLIETVFLPYINARLEIGFLLPIFRGITLQNAEILFRDSRITICSDFSYKEPFDPSRTLVYSS